MKVLVTGHRGFIGQNLYKYLEQKNGIEVIGYEYDPYTMPNVKNVDAVIHLGAISSTVETDVEKVLVQNLDFSIRLLDECEKYQKPFQYASSASVYGNSTTFKETDPVSPKSPYAWSKYLFERHVLQNNYTTVVQGFRYFNVYGRGEEHKKNQASPLSTFKAQAISAGRIKLFEKSINYRRDFVYVGDICDIHYHFLTRSTLAQGIWNVGTGTSVSFFDIAMAIAKKYNAEIQYIPMPEHLKSQYQDFTCADLTKLNRYIRVNWTNVLDWIANEC